MKILALAALLLATASRASELRVSETLYRGEGRYLGQVFQAGALSPTGRWDVSARIKSFQYLDAFKGFQAEYSARVARKLPHVSIAARLGTSPPSGQRASYHLAGGEALLTWYGFRLGPESLDTIATVAEDTATAKSLLGLDRTWVSRLRTRYTTTNHRQTPPTPALQGYAIVQHSWQFDVSMLWRRTCRLSLDGGGDRYDHPVGKTDPTWYLWNVDYAGGAIAVRGWPRNHFGARYDQQLGDFSFGAGFTRMNMSSGDLEILAGGDAGWRPGGRGLELRLGWYQRRRRSAETRAVASLGGSYRW